MTLRTLFLSFLLATLSHAAIATVIAVEGEALIVDATGRTKSVPQAGDALAQNMLVMTREGTVALRWENGSRAVVGPRSKLLIEDTNTAMQALGESFFLIEPLKSATAALKAVAPQSFRVRTKTALIGVRGTEFIVQAGEREEAVLLKTGAVEVEALKGEFEHFKAVAKSAIEAELQAYEAFKDRLSSDFTAYRKKQELEFQAYVKSVTLQPGAALSLQDGQAIERPITPEQEAAFVRYRAFLDPSR